MAGSKLGPIFAQDGVLAPSGKLCSPRCSLQVWPFWVATELEKVSLLPTPAQETFSCVPPDTGNLAFPGKPFCATVSLGLAGPQE